MEILFTCLSHSKYVRDIIPYGRRSSGRHIKRASLDAALLRLPTMLLLCNNITPNLKRAFCDCGSLPTVKGVLKMVTTMAGSDGNKF